MCLERITCVFLLFGDSLRTQHEVVGLLIIKSAMGELYNKFSETDHVNDSLKLGILKSKRRQKFCSQINRPIWLI